jgi:hypothetical protein
MEKLPKIQAPVTQAVYDSYMELYQEAAANGGTHATLMEVLIERYRNPIKVNKANEDKVKSLQEEVNKLNALITDYKSDVDTLIADKKELIEKLDEAVALRAETQREAANKVSLKDCEHIIAIDNLNWLVLNEVAEREGKRRGQSWTVDDIINYFVEKRFVDGELNGDLNSLPDKVINRLRGELGKEE